MLDLVEEVFDVKNDPDQIDVDQSVIERLTQLHPDSLSELKTDDGPYLWILMIPTTKGTM